MKQQSNLIGSRLSTFSNKKALMNNIKSCISKVFYISFPLDIPPQIFTFCLAVFLAQIGHNIQISNSQLILHQLCNTLDPSDNHEYGNVAFILSIATSFDFFGTAIGGLFARYGISARDLLAIAMFLRSVITFVGSLLFHLNFGT